MDKNDIFRILDNPDFIPGIHNYCDSWCERCTMTSRCSSYAIEHEQFSDKENRNPGNEKFWDRISEMFRITIEMLTDMAEKKGIDLNSVDDSAYTERDKVTRAARENECVEMAKQYGKDVELWFENTKDILKEKETELRRHFEMDIPGMNPVKDSTDLNDVIEVIRWYQHQIYVKLMRAVTGRLEGFQDEIEDMPKDYDGSAKVALLGIDRSVGAWGLMLQHIPAEESSILDILVLLERLRKKTETYFPNARSFKRPGFD